MHNRNEFFENPDKYEGFDQSLFPNSEYHAPNTLQRGKTMGDEIEEMKRKNNE